MDEGGDEERRIREGGPTEKDHELVAGLDLGTHGLRAALAEKLGGARAQLGGDEGEALHVDERLAGLPVVDRLATHVDALGELGLREAGGLTPLADALAHDPARALKPLRHGTPLSLRLPCGNRTRNGCPGRVKTL